MQIIIKSISGIALILCVKVEILAQNTLGCGQQDWD